jgi:hypothetical protein
MGCKIALNPHSTLLRKSKNKNHSNNTRTTTMIVVTLLFSSSVFILFFICVAHLPLFHSFTPIIRKTKNNLAPVFLSQKYYTRTYLSLPRMSSSNEDVTTTATSNIDDSEPHCPNVLFIECG